MESGFSSTANRQAKLVGVGGWLTFFCLSLTIVTPILHLNIAAKAFKNLMDPNPLTQGSLIRFSVVFVVYTALALFSCLCGYLLWTENPRGPRVTKAYLVIGRFVVFVL